MDNDTLREIVERVKAGRFARCEARVGSCRFGFTVGRPADPPPAPVPPASGPVDGDLVVRSTLVGRFYSTATAGGDVPPVRPGGRLKKGQRIGMIERMNLEHVIKAECDGTLVETLLDDGEPVMYGQPLFRIRPAKPGGGA